MNRTIFAAGVGVILILGAALVVGAQSPPPPPGFGGGPGPGGPGAAMFEFGGLMGGFGGKVVTGKPILATITIIHTETLPDNSINNTSTGTFARGADGSTYRDVKFAAVGPFVTGGKEKEFAFIRNLATGMEYVVNVTKGTYEAMPIRQRPPRPDGIGGPSGPGSADATVTDNPSATYSDPVTNAVYPVDDRKVTRTVPAGTIGNQNALVITSERWYSSALELLLENVHSDPRFGTTTYQLSNIGMSPAASLFLPDASFTQVQAKFGKHGPGKEPPPPPQD